MEKKKLAQEDVEATIEPKKLFVKVKLNGDFVELFNEVVPDASSYKVLGSKVELRLKKKSNGIDGFAKNGAVGGVIGTVKGIGWYLVRPTLGLVHFTEHVVTGHINAHRKEGEQKHSSMLSRGAMSAIGVQKGLANSYAPSVDLNCADNVIFTSQSEKISSRKA